MSSDSKLVCLLGGGVLTGSVRLPPALFCWGHPTPWIWYKYLLAGAL